jgi:hypothetical protein
MVVPPQLPPSGKLRLAHLRVRNRAWVQSLLRAWHSSLPPVQGWRVAYALKDLDQGEIVGVSTWGRPVARQEDQKTTLEHTRMALGPLAKKNYASWFIAADRRAIRKDFPEVKRLISYVDETKHPGKGVTYRADNWPTVYESKEDKRTEKGKWTRRRGRVGIDATVRTKFERSP